MKLFCIFGILFLVEIAYSGRHKRKYEETEGRDHHEMHARRRNWDIQKSFMKSLNKLEKFNKPNTNWNVKKSNSLNDLTFNTGKGMKQRGQGLKEQETRRGKHERLFGKEDRKQKLQRRRPLLRVFHRRKERLQENKRNEPGHFYTVERLHNMRTRTRGSMLGHNIDHQKRVKGKKNGPRAELHRQNYRRNQIGTKRITLGSMLCKVHGKRTCPEFKREVCGDDGNTYQNVCVMVREMCKKGYSETLISRRGPCEENTLN